MKTMTLTQITKLKCDGNLVDAIYYDEECEAAEEFVNIEILNPENKQKKIPAWVPAAMEGYLRAQAAIGDEISYMLPIRAEVEAEEEELKQAIADKLEELKQEIDISAFGAIASVVYEVDERYAGATIYIEYRDDEGDNFGLKNFKIENPEVLKTAMQTNK